MRKLNRFYFLLIGAFFLYYNSFGQVLNKKNFAKITNAYIEQQFDTLKFLNKSDDILLIGANDIDKDSIYFEICFAKASFLYDMKYEKVYEFKGFKLLIIEEMNKSYLLKGLFKEIPYVNLNNAKIRFTFHPKNWHVTLNKKNEVVSVESEYRFKDVVRKLKKNRVKFAKNFHFIQNLSWQTDDR